MLSLASSAMAQLGIQRLLTAQLILDFSTVAAGFVLGIKVFPLMNAVRRLRLPGVLPLGRLRGLVSGRVLFTLLLRLALSLFGIGLLVVVHLVRCAAEVTCGD